MSESTGRKPDPLAQLRHDLRTPVHQILGYSELLQEEAQETGQESLVADLGKIQLAARQLLKIVDQALASPASPLAAAMAAVVAPPPVVPAPLPPLPVVFREDKSATGEGGEDLSGAAGHVLVVDDNEMNRDMLSRRLAGRGYRVTGARDGREALRLVEEGFFDAMLLDVMMPDLSGIEVLTRIRRTYSQSDLPVIMATARDASEDVVEALRLGANDYVTKPLDFPVVLARLETQLAVKKQKEQIARLATDLELRNRFIQNTFGRYLSDDVVKSLLESPEGLKLGGERRKVTILMSDLRGFTSLSESLGPEEVVRTLNGYLGAMAEVILRHQGLIDEFIGDAVLAIFGAPEPRPDDARRAVACAVHMQLAVDALNEKNLALGLPRIEMGVAIHTGEVVVGNIGSERRAKYGVVGAPVNHAGRIESFTVGGQILVSEATLQQAGGEATVGERFTIDAKGAREPLVVYDLLGVTGENAVSLPARSEAFVPLRRELGVDFSVMAGKTVGAERFPGGFVEISASGGVLRSARGLRALSDLKMTLMPAGRAPVPELYAKVLGSRGKEADLFRVRFTSVPAEVAALLRDLLNEAPAQG
ncbi:MAG TPA: adenylate/guanylate cyclase domain-containing protein [Vicinamibacteria bacterium]|nr:adenylate/guanylate cyclase domain-containing protein [Vicinamibacteria bacterium]